MQISHILCSVMILINSVVFINSVYGQEIFNQEALASLKIFNEKEINTANIESSPAFMGDKIAFVFTDVKGKLFDKEID